MAIHDSGPRTISRIWNESNVTAVITNSVVTDNTGGNIGNANNSGGCQ